MARIVCSNLSKHFGAVSVVRNLNLEIRDGEFLVLLGPSGCGKTTTLNIIAGLEELSEGELRFDDQVVNFVPPHRRNIAMVFQSYALYPQKTVYDNIAFGLTLARTPQQEIDARVRSAAKQLEITHLLDRKPAQLSGGQRQRVALGRAIVRKPSVFLMDEPLSNLDAALRVSTRALIKSLHQSLRTTFVYVTHDQAEAMTLADRIVVMNHGEVQQLGTPEEIYHAPRNLFVAAFLGSPQMNFVDGMLEERGSGLAFVHGALVLPLAQQDLARARRQGTRPTVLGLRPEDIDVRPSGDGPEIVRATIGLVAPLGSETHVNARVGEVDLVLRLDKEMPAAVGDVLRFSVPAGRMHLFDKETGVALAD